MTEREKLARIIRTQMREWWDEICSDTNCHPIDLKHGRGKVLFYEPSHWTDAVAKFSADAILAALTPPAAEGVDDEAAREWLQDVCGKHPSNRQDHAMLAERFARHRLASPTPMREEGRMKALIKKIDEEITDIVARIGGEGDRAFLGSTNDVETLKDLMRETEREVYRIMEAEGD